ncbi:rod-binding protein [Roseibaca sp. Y0-43]|uniref:rod-binding protein n=1 Tax=Roseibaca sp. Y0-43 TaxID=2816854 RepID=UPI001D0C8313|nr:rod-binding protein [Roseibaca sp. Y0-43]MCC1481301.1 rod-binding protein [Roseibaca sp. Y0-43]
MIDPISPNMSRAVPQARLTSAAQAFEAAFLSQMLSAAGAGKTEAFGGIGEAQFASFLVDAQAERIAQRGGIGLAETIIRHYSQKD